MYTFPKNISNKAIGIYFLSFIVVTLMYLKYTLPFMFWCFGIVSVLLFFLGANKFSTSWQYLSIKSFEKKLFWTSFSIRLCWVIFFYYFNVSLLGDPLGWQNMDASLYLRLGRYIMNNGFSVLPGLVEELGVSDSGYITYLGLIYTVFTDSFLLVWILKSALSSFMSVLIYRLASRNFGEETGRIAGVLAVVMPHLIYYCGVHLKELEMVFITTFFAERADFVLRSKKIVPINIAVTLILGLTLFSFRTVLGASCILALISAIIFTHRSTISWKKKIMLGFWLTLVVGYFMGGKIWAEVEDKWENRSENQDRSMEWREKREGGNALVTKYAGAAVFAPLITTIPFPTFVNTAGQENVKIMNGSNFIKNITSFFTLLAIFSLLISGTWRNHVFLLAMYLGYLAVIALSAFAHSERFHFPSIPFAIILAAHGISLYQQNKKYRHWFHIWSIFIFVVIVFWSWFKLAGRGLA